MPDQIHCPDCRRLQRPREEFGQLICPECSAVLPSREPEAAPPAKAGAAQNGVRTGLYRPHRDCNHIDLPLGTGIEAGLPKRTRYVVA